MQIISVVCRIITGIILPLATAKQIVYFTSSKWQQLLIMSFMYKLDESIERQNKRRFDMSALMLNILMLLKH